MPPLLPEFELDSTDILKKNYSSSPSPPRRATLSKPTVIPLEAIPERLPARKRKRSASVESHASNASLSIQSEPDIDLAEVTEKKHVSSGFVGVHPPDLVHPKSLYLGHEPSGPRAKERSVLKEILEAEADISNASADDFISVDLNEFVVYRPHQAFNRSPSRTLEAVVSEKPRANELVSLHELNGRLSTLFLFSGTVRFGDDHEHRRYLQHVSFETLSIGCYEDTNLHTVGADIWIQSPAGKASNVWYRLRQPAEEYFRYHEPFLWLADLAKHIVDFLNAHTKITLNHFKSIFVEWLQKVHGSHGSFLLWRRKHPSPDFRHAVAAHVGFLYNQAGQLGSRYARHPLWGEIDPTALTAIPRRLRKRADSRTVVTPFVYDCFKHLPWAKFLDPVLPENVPNQSASIKIQTASGPSTVPQGESAEYQLECPQLRITCSTGKVQPGDVVAICSDKNTKWKTKNEEWFAFVQGLEPAEEEHQFKLRLIWIYRPADTACQDTRYPLNNELFLSDHCNCGDSPIYLTDVLRKVSVAFFGLPEVPRAEYFIRQNYSSTDSHWTTLQESDLTCPCKLDQCSDSDSDLDTALDQYGLGDTLLVRAVSPDDIHTLEPVVLVEKYLDRKPGQACVRRLLRKRDDLGDNTAEPNELVYTRRCDICNTALILRRCHVRIYTPDDRVFGRIPAPYNRKGAGDCYYILWTQQDSEDYKDVQLNQGFNPLEPRIPLRGLDIFCGGGNFGRGLEESRVVKMDWAVDLFNEAIHTYYANNQESTKLYNGSVNEYLSDAIKGKRNQSIAGPGDVAVIVAGSPCQGFSVANRNYDNDQSLRNISLVASVVAFVDFYRPKYVLMENVLGMANCGPKRVGIFSQVLSVLVALGYQVRPMLLDSWNFGAPQSRSRVFITAAAPGLTPMTRPPASHSHPRGIIGRSLGKAANGLPFGVREWDPTPFEYVSIGEATKDLPRNPDSRTVCISCPDHRVIKNFSAVDNVRLSCIPRFPPGMNFVQSAELGWQSAPQMAAWDWDSKLRSGITSKAWQRAKSNALLPTVTTINAPNEALTGSDLHWDAHRPLTVMEARRAQGFPDDEVLIGTPATQWKIIGNSVARQVAIALGMSLREAWLAHDPQENERDQRSSVNGDTAEAAVLEAMAGFDLPINVDEMGPTALPKDIEYPMKCNLHCSQQTDDTPSVGKDISNHNAQIRKASFSASFRVPSSSPFHGIYDESTLISITSSAELQQTKAITASNKN